MENTKRGASFKAAISITLTALIAGFSLSFLNALWAEDIEANERNATLSAIQRVIPKATSIKGPVEDGNVSYYIGYDSKHKAIGYAIRVSEVGYGGNVPVVVGYDANLSKITTIVPLDNLETPNIGSKIADEPFRSSFDGGSATRKYRLVKTGKTDVHTGDINSITGATVSSSVVILCVNNANDYVVKNRNKIKK